MANRNDSKVNSAGEIRVFSNQWGRTMGILRAEQRSYIIGIISIGA